MLFLPRCPHFERAPFLEPLQVREASSRQPSLESWSENHERSPIFPRASSFWTSSCLSMVRRKDQIFIAKLVSRQFEKVDCLLAKHNNMGFAGFHYRRASPPLSCLEIDLIPGSPSDFPASGSGPDCEYQCQAGGRCIFHSLSCIKAPQFREWKCRISFRLGLFS